MNDGSKKTRQNKTNIYSMMLAYRKYKMHEKKAREEKKKNKKIYIKYANSFLLRWRTEQSRAHHYGG